MVFMTSRWQNARQPALSSVLATHLRELARPVQIAFARIMTAHKGNPVGVEFRHRFGRSWAFVLEDASEPGYRIQFFDSRGVLGHQHYATLEGAVEEMVSQGYTVEDSGAFDRAASTKIWAECVPYLDLMQNRTWSEAAA